jgi:hypothetical protein
MMTDSVMRALGTPAYFEDAGIPTTPTELSRDAAVICSYDKESSDSWCFRRVFPVSTYGADLRL